MEVKTMMAYRIVLAAFLLLPAFVCQAQEVKKVQATYTYYAPENISLEEAKRTAFERAKIQAIADVFGTVVSQSNSTVVKNENGNSSIDFFSLGSSEVKGEWIETLKETVDGISHDSERGMMVVTVSVVGKAREIVSAAIDLDVEILRNGTDLKFADLDFRTGDRLYVYFKAPLNGHLAIYLLDETTMQVYCLLPYLKSGIGSMAIKHDKPYIFFSDKHRYDKITEVNEYRLTANRPVETNRIYTVFSPNDFVKANADVYSNTTPRQLGYEEFQKWLEKVRRHDEKVCVRKHDVKIRRL